MKAGQVQLHRGEGRGLAEEEGGEAAYSMSHWYDWDGKMQVRRMRKRCLLIVSVTGVAGTGGKLRQEPPGRTQAEVSPGLAPWRHRGRVKSRVQSRENSGSRDRHRTDIPVGRCRVRRTSSVVAESVGSHTTSSHLLHHGER